jgi:hypothetical protein
MDCVAIDETRKTFCRNTMEIIESTDQEIV